MEPSLERGENYPAGGTIDVSLRQDGEHVEIVVRDSGEGIDPVFLPHVFERFRQADSAPSRKHGGLGLGLAIVRHLTEAHEGTVSATSDGPGMGSTFVVPLPLVGPRHAAAALPAVPTTSPRARPASAACVSSWPMTSRMRES